MCRSVIGVVPLVDSQRESLWMLPGYLDSLRLAGAIPIILPLTTKRSEIKQLLGMCDGILFTGGQDVQPALYGEMEKPTCGETCIERDIMENILLEEVLLNNIPFLGICRGIQFINVLLGGTLYQDLPSDYGKEVEHHMTPPYDRAAHMVDIVPDSPLHAVLSKDRIPVNSYHHQAIRDLAPVLKPMAYSEDGLIEAVHHPGVEFGWAVQWHPEFSYRSDMNSLIILRSFVNAADAHRLGEPVEFT